MEILFKAKRFGDGAWVDGTMHDCGDGRMYILNGTPEDPVWDEVDPDTAGMFTSLRDKHGRMIFDGDIVRLAGCYFVIHWGTKHARFEMQRLRHEGEFGSRRFFHTEDLREGMIVGNRWDNPELMEVKAWR